MKYILLMLLASLAFADTPPPGSVKIKGGTDSTVIGNVGDALKVSGSFTSTGLTNAELRATPVPVTVSNLASVSITNFPALQAISAATLPLPSGAATAANQATANASLSSIDAKLTSPLSVTGPLTDSQIRASALPVSAASLPLPSGAATSTKQDTGNTSLASIDAKLTNPLPVSASSLPLPSGAATSAKQDTGNTSLSSIDSKLTSPLTVTGPLTNAQLRASDVGVSVSNFPATQPVSGTVAVSNFPATQAVTQSTSPWVVSGSLGRTWTLSSGGDSVTASLAAGSNTVGKVDQGSGGASAWKVDGSAVTQPISAASLPLPSGAATETSLAKLTQTQGSTTSGQSGPLVQGAVTTNVPAYTTAQTSPLSLNTRGALRVKQTGLDTVNLIRNDYSSVNVTTAAYVQLVASTASEINSLHIFDSSGQDFVLAVGGAGAEVDQIQIPPGGWDAPVFLYIPAGSRLSIKSKSATASSGILLITGIK